MSNIYPVWWDQSLTIYNKYEDPQTQVVTWYRHVIDNCFWQYRRDKVNVGETVLETSSIICRIPKRDDFMEKHQWINVPYDQMSNYFTLGVGDIIVRGTVTDEINEYTRGHRSTDILNKYKDLQGCMQIELVSINTGAGRGNEHYLAKGN